MIESYRTGRGGFRVRARWSVEDLGRGGYQIVVTAIPYQVQKSRLIEKIAELLIARKLPLLEDIRDESAEDVRVVLVPKSRSVDANILMESLFKLTELESRIPLNMNVLSMGRVPRVMALNEVLSEWLAHRREVLQRRSRHRLAAIDRRLEILGGYLVAYLNIDEVIRIIREEDEPKAVMIERFSLTDVQAEAILNMRLRSLRKLEEHFGRQAYATMPIEVGGVNSTIPLVVAARLGLPVVDADGMGRAFPELQMETFNVYGVPGTPMVISNEHGDSTIIETRDNTIMEWLARGVTIRMGGAAYIAEYAMDGATARRTSVPGTLTLAHKIGSAIAEARARHVDPFAHVIDTLADTPYKFGTVIFAGKIVDVWRETTQGFAKGRAVIDGWDPYADQRMDIAFQNENLVARVDGTVAAIVPDLICVLDSETAEPITTEALRYGQRVTVMAVSVPELMRTPEALAVFGPAAFGLDEAFRPIEDLAA